MRTLLAAAALAALTVSASAQPAAQPQREERGALRVENVPQTPPDVRERLQQYVNTRAAGFSDWLSDGGILITTRFGDTVQVHRVNEPMGARTQLTFFEERVLGAAVRPGGGDIMFARDVGGNEQYGGYLLDASGRSRAFTQPDTRNESFTWSDDGAQIAWSYVPNTEPNYDIYVSNADGSNARRVLDAEGAVYVADFSPDGTKLLLGRYISVAESQLSVLDIATGAVTRITPELTVSYGGGEFTPDGRSIITTSDEGSLFARLVRIDLATGARTPLSPADLNWDVDSFDLSHDGRTIAYVINEAGRSQVRVMDARTGRAQASPQIPAGVIGGVSIDPAGRRLGFTLNSATAPGDVYTWDLRARRLTRWTQSETGGIPPSTFVEPDLVSWRSFDQREITGFIYRPRTQARHPVIISIHGGPEGQARPAFSSTTQYWVNELGAAVITPNVRGSTGYGKEFVALDNGPLREDSVRDIGALLDWIATQPDLDPNRVIVYGGSYGGYMVLASMTHYNDRLAGAVDIVGISNFATFLETTSGYRRDLRRAEYGDERDPEMRAVFDRISPLNRINEVNKPIFVIHGFNDPRVPVSEAEQVYAAVRRNGGRAWLMIAMNEGHGFSRRENQQAQREAETLFFREVLGLQ